MANLNDIGNSVKKGFKKLGDQVEKAADIASLRIKLTSIAGKLDEYYCELGRLTYLQLRGTAPDDVQKRIDNLLAKINGKMAEKSEAEEELERVRKAGGDSPESEDTETEPEDTQA